MFRISLFALMFSSAGFAIAQSSYSFTELSCPDSSSTHALGINGSNLIVGECRSTGLLHGFLYDGDSFDTVEPPDASRSAANGINLGGVLVGYYQTPGSQFYRGFMRIDESTYRHRPPGDCLG
jgi:hypothetical protein